MIFICFLLFSCLALPVGLVKPDAIPMVAGPEEISEKFTVILDQIEFTVRDKAPAIGTLLRKILMIFMKKQEILFFLT